MINQRELSPFDGILSVCYVICLVMYLCLLFCICRVTIIIFQ